ncbi:hypothetical protein RYX36_000233, partial [Vicia faba]
PIQLLFQHTETRNETGIGKDLSDDQISFLKGAFTLFETDSDGGNLAQDQLKSIFIEENLTLPLDFNRFLDLMSKRMKTEPCG